MKEEIKNQIKKLKEEKNAVILAHYYVDGEVQEIADYVGDSYFLAKKATEIPAEVIIFCGVSFMGESAKILNPGKTVIMADEHADCPMAHMIDVDRIREVRNLYSDAAVVCYVNSTAEIKAESDVCVTSSKAVTRKVTHDLHYLLLIYDTSIRRCKNWFKLWTVIFNVSLIILSLDVLWYKIHRSRTIKRYSGDNIFHALRF